MTKWTHLIYLSIIAGLSYLVWQQPAAITPTAQHNANTISRSSEPDGADPQQSEAKLEPVVSAEAEERVAHNDLEVADIEFADNRGATEKPPQTARTSLNFTDAEMAEMLKKAINVDKVKELLHTEAVDQDLAYAMQDNLQLLYDKNEALHRATLNHIECYTTVCEVQFTNTEAPIDFMSSFHHKMVQEPWYNGNYQSVMTTDSETQTQTFYIVRSN